MALTTVVFVLSNFVQCPQRIPRKNDNRFIFMLSFVFLGIHIHDCYDVRVSLMLVFSVHVVHPIKEIYIYIAGRERGDVFAYFRMCLSRVNVLKYYIEI
jgi:hypothetical protein